MEIVVAPSASAANDLATELIARAIADDPALVLGLPTGRTVEDVYARLARRHQEDGLDFAGVRTFNIDEYVGLPDADDHSYHCYMRERLFRHVNIRPENFHLPSGVAPDLQAECERYEHAIAACGGIGLQLLGIGENGHIGFNEPPSDPSTRTRVVTLSPETRAQNAPLFSDPERMPRQAVTMGLGTILDARRCLLLATGEAKAAVVARALEGPLAPEAPGSYLRAHPCCAAILDPAAASLLCDADALRRPAENG